jgi:hypothetical protein
MAEYDMKFRLLDRITDYTPNHGISVVHTAGLEEILSARRIGSAEVPRSFLLALAVEAAGFFCAAESDFQFWAKLKELENLRINLSNHNDGWCLELIKDELKEDESTRMFCKGAVSGIIKLDMVDLATLYDPQERRAMFKEIQRS